MNTKTLTAHELAEVVRQIAGSEKGLETEVYERFVGDLAALVTQYCGGDVVAISMDNGDGLGVSVLIAANNDVPADGGIYLYLDTDVSIETFLGTEVAP